VSASQRTASFPVEAELFTNHPACIRRIIRRNPTFPNAPKLNVTAMESRRVTPHRAATERLLRRWSVGGAASDGCPGRVGGLLGRGLWDTWNLASKRGPLVAREARLVRNAAQQKGSCRRAGRAHGLLAGVWLADDMRMERKQSHPSGLRSPPPHWL
jgi:hypothetical protein